MVQSNRADQHDSATQSKFYLPAKGTPSFATSRVESLWATLFNHQI